MGRSAARESPRSLDVVVAGAGGAVAGVRENMVGSESRSRP